MKHFIYILLLTVVSCTVFPDDPYGHQQYPSGPESHGRRHEATAYSSSFFVATDRHERGENLTTLLQRAVAGSTVWPQTVILGGDYVGGRGNMTPAFSISDLYDEIYSVVDPAKTEVVLTFGSHDNCCTDGYSAFFSGPRRCDGYYVYGVSFRQMACDMDTTLVKDNDIDTLDRFGLSAETAARHFSTWVSTLRDDAPIVVMSHMPLHAHRRDNKGGQIWFDALDAAARNHAVFFLWGHNHTLEEPRPGPPPGGDNPMPEPSEDTVNEQDFYLLAPGDSITVQTSVDSISVGRKLRFTYVNAGYIKLGHASVFTFTDTDYSGSYDRVRIERFSLDEESREASFGNTRYPNPYEARLSTEPGHTNRR